MIPKIEEYLNRKLSNDEIEKYTLWKKLFIEYNSHTNLMSKNEIPYLFEKHVIDSLSISKIKEFELCKKLLDVGAGGGFPSLILSIFNSTMNIIAVDSISKKTKFLSCAKEKLNLENLTIINDRIEKIPSLNVDIITNRAVGKIDLVWNLSKNHLKKGGIFVSYKAKNAKEEAEYAAKIYKELKNPEFFNYLLPTKEKTKRVLVIFKKN